MDKLTGGAFSVSRPLFHYSWLSHKAAFSIWRDHMKDTTQLYIYPASYAREHGELEQYRASYKANIACKEAIEQAIADHYRDNHLGTEAVHQVLEQFGYDRMFYVLANTVRQKDWDGRISRDNKAWAKTIPVYENPDGFGQDRNVYFVVDRSHPGLTDLFLTQARKEYALSQEKKPSVRDSLNKNAGQQTRAEKPKQHKSQER
ncbi:DUF3849 domain-containing protein [Intestinimonas timonensis]|uniref:DUF3849 domain-containing protein n=1 Tax=Intestinimonas timonensis TaxID=1689270 RepID=UPI001F5FCE8E|nr:DUF3849 domain-containing protein [Intestinimonas timonensis]